MTILKQTSSQNLKKCLKASIYFILSWTLGWPGSWANSFAAPTDLVNQLRADITHQKKKNLSFSLLTKKWENEHGTRAFQPLIQIASDRHMPDSDRYIALMSATKLGGRAAIPNLLPFLQDGSWMIRGGALRALSMIGDSQTGEAILPLLRDPALVVRVEAVEAIRTLRPKGATQALVSTFEDQANYHAGKAQWVPQKALLALTTFHPSEVVPKLKPFLENQQKIRDPEFRNQIQRALNALRK